MPLASRIDVICIAGRNRGLRRAAAAALRLLVAALLLLSVSRPCEAQVASVTPRLCPPGQTTQLTFKGKNLDASWKVLTHLAGATLDVKSAEPTQLTVDLSLPNDAPLGPLGLWTVGPGGPQEPLQVIVDDLKVAIDNGKNHTIESAQPIATLCAVQGSCDKALSDFYRITVTDGQRVAFEIHTQALRSPVDPVVRLLDAHGGVLKLVDDGAVGPDCRFSYRFSSAGDFYVQVHDNRYGTGDYHLRVGDFPILTHPYPLAIQRGQPLLVRFVGEDGSSVSERHLEFPSQTAGDRVNVSAKLAGGESSAWLPISISGHRQVVETELSAGAETRADEALSLPVGVQGRLSKPGERDSYRILGTKGQPIRISSHTRSVGCPTILQMQLFDEKDAKLVETKVADSDEWSLDYTFPEDGEYRLEVFDLIKRGGEGFAYWLDIAPAGSFSLALKPEAANRQGFTIESEVGACAIDLQVSRFGFDGAIDLSIDGDLTGLRILNPRIPAKATEARVYLAAGHDWKPESSAVARLTGSATENPGTTAKVSSHALSRLKQPFVLVPPAWNDGALLFAGIAKVDAPFAVEPVGAVQFARPVTTHTASLVLKRVQDQFQAGVTLLNDGLPEGWTVSAQADKDNYTATFTRSSLETAEPESLQLRVFGEFQGRGRIETSVVPVDWIDPVTVTLEAVQPWIAGGRVTVRASVAREGADPQPVTLNLAELPPGVSGPESITVAADQAQSDFELTIAPDAKADIDRALRLVASSQYGGQAFTVASNELPVPIIALPKRLEVHPAEMTLDGPRSKRQLVVTGFDSAEVPRDWTHQVRMQSADEAVATVVDGVVFPKSDGKTEIVLQIGDVRKSVPVTVTNFHASALIAFESEVLVALSKQGCNSGACHGSPSGKGGFRLSLRAFDKQLDELTLIREDFGRRVNTLEPSKSLLLLKPTMKLAHGGGKQLRSDDDAYAILRDWIAEGAHADPDGTPRCGRLHVYPDQKRVLALAGGGQQLSVVAEFADQSKRDVSHLAAYESSNTEVATVDGHGWVTPHRQGETVILVRYLEHIESVPLMFVEPRTGFEWRSPTPHNYVDELVDLKLKQLQYLPSEVCDDPEFLRRVHLDLIGVLPTVQEAQAFLADQDPEKRIRLVDALLEREEYAKFWALKWGDLLQMTSKLVGDEGVYKYHRWLEQSLRENMPYDKFVTQLLTGSGSTLGNPPANFYRTATDMNECVETVSQVFLGARLQCAKCHNHPFERWTQDNYYGLGAFFHGVARRSTERPGEMFVYSIDSGDVVQPRTGEKMAPWLPTIGSITPEDHQDRRQTFAAWLVDPANPFFARIEANRIWSQLFARGIVDPIDDFRDSNPPTNRPLLDALAKDFVESGYDRKHLLRVITSSRTYQASYRTHPSNWEDTLYFSHQQPRLLGAEQLLDAINQTLGLSQAFGGLPAGTKATQLPAPDIANVEFLKVFGQPERSTVCACERPGESNLGMAIELFNGPMMHEKLRDPKNRFRTALAAGKSIEETVVELYLAALSRPPLPSEMKAALDHCGTREDPASGVEDVCWALFNTDEFLFQH